MQEEVDRLRGRVVAAEMEVAELRAELERLRQDMLAWPRAKGNEEERVTRFEVDLNDATSVLVRAGTWERNGIRLDLAETKVDGFDAAATTYWVWLALDDALAPTTVSVEMGTSVPSDGPGNRYRVLAKVKTTADGGIGLIEQRDKGDGDDEVVVADAGELEKLREVIETVGNPDWRRWIVEDQGSGTVRVNVGAWTRQGTTVTLTPDMGQTYKTLGSCGSDDYVYAQLESSTRDPALIPDSVKVYRSATDPRDDSETEGIVWVLGKFASSVWEQWWFGGDIDDWAEVPDANENTSGSPARSTLQRNPEATEDERTLQMYDVHNVQHDAISVPAFQAATASADGVLIWAAVDTNRDVSSGGSASQRSLEIREEAVGDPPVTRRMLQLYGVDEADHTQVVRISDVAGLMELEYVWLIRFESDPCVGAAAETDLLDADGFGLSANGTELTLAFKKRTYEVVDGQSNLEAAVADSSVVDLEDSLDGWLTGLGGYTGTVRVVTDAGTGDESDLEFVDGLLKSVTPV
jgi:hypothetical protein